MRAPIAILLAALLAGSARAQDIKEGSVLDVGGLKATVTKLDALPYVVSEFTQRFKFDAFDNPKLKELRERYKLDDVVAPGRDEFDRQVLLLDWTHFQFKKFGRPTANPKGALEILKGVEEGHTFFCAHYGATYCSAAASLGWIDRTLALRRHKDYPGAGAPEHTSTEIWSNQFRKWVVMDPTANMFVEKDGVPLNGVEIRTEWFEREGKDLVFVVGKERKRYRRADLPIFLARFPGFGDLTVPANEMEKYGFIGYVPNTNLMDAGDDYGKMFIVKDKWCEAKWHERTNPPNPAVDPYFPIGQATLSLSVDGGKLRVGLQTMTPNFKEFQVRIDGGPWKVSGEAVLWSLHAGANRLEARTQNRFGVDGPVSTVDLAGSP
ncbi:MAG TPA: hypothetical protein VKW04_09940 [Planctomycetota bacterium]|nr:hypothetical protein [Planctomycetota bacterium]